MFVWLLLSDHLHRLEAWHPELLPQNEHLTFFNQIYFFYFGFDEIDQKFITFFDLFDGFKSFSDIFLFFKISGPSQHHILFQHSESILFFRVPLSLDHFYEVVVFQFCF
jgi:hypothetical protein